MRSRIIFLFLLAFVKNLALAKELNYKSIEKSIVKVKATPNLCIYGKGKEKNGIGCIIDKKRGWILTTKDIANNISLANYEVMLYNGLKLSAKIQYFDGWINLAILEVESSLLPNDIDSVKFAKNISTDEREFNIVSNNDDSKISFVKCKVFAKEAIQRLPLPQQCYGAKFYKNGSFSSSPVLNADGDLVSLVVLQDNSAIWLLDPSYIRLFFNENRNFIFPRRKHIGVVCKLVSIYDILETGNISKEIYADYIKKFPNCQGLILTVSNIIKGTPADKNLQIDDLILAVDNIDIGPNLSALDLYISQKESESISLKVVRNGKIQNIELLTYDFENFKIKNAVELCSTVFFESDEFYSLMTGIPIGKLCTYKSNSPVFREMAAYQLEGNEYILMAYDFELMGEKLESLKNLNKIIPKIIDYKDLSIKYRTVIPNFNPLSDFYSGVFSESKLIAVVSIDKNDKNFNLKEYILK